MRRLRPTYLLATLAVLSGATGWAATITITATFTYPGPDGAQQPCRWCWCELRD